MRERVVPVASPACAEQHGLTEMSGAAEVNAVPTFVHMDDGESPWMSWAEWLAYFDIALQRGHGRVLVNNYPLVLQQAIVGRGVALGWRPLVDELIEGDALRVVGPEVESHRGYHATWRSGASSAAVQGLLDWLDEIATD